MLSHLILTKYMLLQRYSLVYKLRKWLQQAALIAIALLICGYVYGAKIEPNWIEVVPIQLTLPNLSPAFDGFKLVQISDLHVSRFMPRQRLEKIIRLVNQQFPDAIAITGDIITKHQDFDATQLSQILVQLAPESINLAVLGNHDHWRQGINKLKRALAYSKITNLDNQVYVIQRGEEKLAIGGLDDPYWGKPDLEQVISQLPAHSPAILLVHEPDYIATSAKTHKFALQIAGHSHGGQIRIPYTDPLILPSGAKKYFAGLYQVEDTWGYTNRGLGMTAFPLRINSRPEITVFTLHSPDSES